MCIFLLQSGVLWGMKQSFEIAIFPHVSQVDVTIQYMYSYINIFALI